MTGQANWNLPSVKELVTFGLRGVLYILGFLLVFWGLFWYWPPFASNERVMLGAALLLLAETFRACHSITYLEPAPSTRERIRWRGVLTWGAWFTFTCLFFWAFLTGENPLTRLRQLL